MRLDLLFRGSKPIFPRRKAIKRKLNLKIRKRKQSKFPSKIDLFSLFA
jgi:hypothetical protein